MERVALEFTVRVDRFVALSNGWEVDGEECVMVDLLRKLVKAVKKFISTTSKIKMGDDVAASEKSSAITTAIIISHFLVLRGERVRRIALDILREVDDE